MKLCSELYWCRVRRPLQQDVPSLSRYPVRSVCLSLALSISLSLSFSLSLSHTHSLSLSLDARCNKVRAAVLGVRSCMLRC